MTNGVPIGIKIAGGNIENDLKIVVKVDPEVIVVDGGEGGTGAAPTIAKDHAGLPLPFILPRVINYLKKRKVRDRYTLIAAGGLKGPEDFVKALALGADAVYSSGYFKFALGCVYCRSCESGKCPTGITTQDPALRKRLNVDERSKHVENLLKISTHEIAKICRLTGCNDVNKLDFSYMRSLNSETAEITGVPLANKVDPNLEPSSRVKF